MEICAGIAPANPLFAGMATVYQNKQALQEQRRNRDEAHARETRLYHSGVGKTGGIRACKNKTSYAAKSSPIQYR